MLIFLATQMFVVLLQTYVIQSIAGLYQIGFITQLSFVQIFGALVVISIVAHKHKHEESEEKEFIENITNIFKSQIYHCLYFLTTWGIAAIVYHFIE